MIQALQNVCTRTRQLTHERYSHDIHHHRKVAATCTSLCSASPMNACSPAAEGLPHVYDALQQPHPLARPAARALRRLMAVSREVGDEQLGDDLGGVKRDGAHKGKLGVDHHAAVGSHLV